MTILQDITVAVRYLSTFSRLARSNQDLLLVVLVALLVRFGTFMPVHVGGYTSDEREYISMARQLADGKEFVDSNGERSTRAPLFPFLLAVIFKATGGYAVGAHLVNCLLGTAAVVFGYLLSKQLWNNRQAALVCAGVIAVYPGLVIYSTLLQTETLYVLLFLLALWCAYRMIDRPTPLLAIGVGVFSGLAALTRVVFLGFFPLLILYIMWTRKGTGKSVLTQVAVAVVAFCVVVAPWTIRNYHLHHAFVPISSGSGNSLLTGNNPFATGTWRLEQGFEEWYNRSALELGVPDVTTLTEVEKSDLSGRIARAYIVSHPLDVLRLMAKKGHIFFVYPISYSDSLLSLQAFAVACDYLLLLGVVVGLVSSWGARGRIGLIWLAMIFFSVVQLILHSEARFRLPLVPLFAMLFGIGVSQVSGRQLLKEFFSVKAKWRAAAVLVCLVTVVYIITGLLFLRGSI